MCLSNFRRNRRGHSFLLELHHISISCIHIHLQDIQCLSASSCCHRAPLSWCIIFCNRHTNFFFYWCSLDCCMRRELICVSLALLLRCPPNICCCIVFTHHLVPHLTRASPHAVSVRESSWDGCDISERGSPAISASIGHAINSSSFIEHLLREGRGRVIRGWVSSEMCTRGDWGLLSAIFSFPLFQ